MFKSRRPQTFFSVKFHHINIFWIFWNVGNYRRVKIASLGYSSPKYTFVYTRQIFLRIFSDKTCPTFDMDNFPCLASDNICHSFLSLSRLLASFIKKKLYPKASYFSLYLPSAIFQTIVL